MSVASSSLSFAAHLPAFQVIVPLIAAPVCSILRRGVLPWALAFAVSIVALAVSSTLLLRVVRDGVVDYHLGGWPPPIGIAFRVDMANAIVLVLVAAIAVATLAFARRSVDDEIPAHSQPLFYTCFLLALTGLLGLTITGDAFNFFVFLEISSLSTYTLVAMGAARDRRALTASFSYLVMGTIGATFFVIGLGFLYALTGTLNMVDLAGRLVELRGSRGLPVAFAFITVGLGLKLAMFPLHTWLPNAYTYAPTAVTTFIAATATKTAIYALLRFVYTVFGFEFGFERALLPYLMMPLGFAGMFMGAAIAIFQVDLKRMLAWSSVSQIGYMLVGVGLSLSTVTGLQATFVHMLNHALMKATCFMALGAVLYRTTQVSIGGIAGVGKQMPWTMAAFVVGGLSLIGVPGTVGFISKWYLVKAAFEANLWWVAVLVMLSSLLAVVYVWRVIEAAYFRDPPLGRIVEEAPLSMLVPLWVLAGGCLYFGIDADTTATLSYEAARTLLEGVR